nr:PREDICTED: esterase E4-like [Bemisia tabaci]
MQDAVPKQSFDGVFDATKDGPVCVQRQSIKFGDEIIVIGEEDCLTINVYTPACPQATNPPSNNSLPVFVLFHFGSWVEGSNREAIYGPEFLLNRDVVLAVPNYRLDAIGFLNTGDNVTIGNYGFRDQVLALQWVQDNIAAFGGDPSRVTLIGESSGGSAATLHLMSPLSKGLFAYVIAMSGSALSPLSFTERPVAANATQRLAELVGCPVCPSEDLTNCMRNVPAETLILAQVNLTSDRFPPFVQLYFLPTLDYDYLANPTFPFDPRIADMTEPIPLMTGSSTNDGLFYLSAVYNIPGFEELIYKYYKYFLARLMDLGHLFPMYAIPTVMDRVYSRYFQDQPLSRDYQSNLKQMFTDYDFFITTAIPALRHAKIGAPTWYYVYDYETEVSFNDLLFDPSISSTLDKPGHLDNLLTLFPMPEYFPNRTYSDAEIEFIRNRVDLWVTFAATGNPTTGNDNIQWDQVGSLENCTVLVLDKNYRLDNKYRRDALLFWIDLLQKYSGLQIL